MSYYPAPAEDYNPHTIPSMIERFGLISGLSDHRIDNTTAITSIAMDASIIEKHFTLDRNGGGPDDIFSQELTELVALCRDSKIASASMGKIDYGLKSSAQANFKYLNSPYYLNQEKRKVITEDMVKSVRPGYRLPQNERFYHWKEVNE